ncbi:MAG: rRNA maturation RNase YbeY [Paludibacteraceae bacterium]|nr:rRNA maturation RNase YbeY [Paludibacteraceae bacterium]
MLHFVTENIDMPPINPARIENWLRRVAAGYGFALGDITYIFCDDNRILEVNRQFLQHDYYTDVITFDYTTPGRVSGDIYLSLETIRSNAEMVGVDYMDEVHRILVHGLLHLTGQGDKTPETKAVMTEKEDKALAIINENDNENAN